VKYNRLTLAFCDDDQHLEEMFCADYFRISLQLIRVAILIGLFLYSLFGILDAMLLSEAKKIVWIIRYGVVCPTILSVYLFSFSRHFKQYWQAALALGTLVAGLGIIGMIVLAPPLNFSYYVGLVLIIFCCYTFVRIRFIWATLVCWTIVLFYQVAAIQIGETATHILVSNNFFFISANIVGMFASYSIEHYARKNFYLVRLLEDEKRKSDEANKQLESKVLELKEASNKIKTLKGLLPICAKCKKIRDDKGYWNQIEEYMKEHAGVEFSHGICPECMQQLYPELPPTENKDH
jgi:hypothetical protein